MQKLSLELEELIGAANPDVSRHLSKSELDGLFDYGYFLRHVDAVFERLGLG